MLIARAQRAGRQQRLDIGIGLAIELFGKLAERIEVFRRFVADVMVQGAEPASRPDSRVHLRIAIAIPISIEVEGALGVAADQMNAPEKVLKRAGTEFRIVDVLAIISGIEQDMGAAVFARSVFQIVVVAVENAGRKLGQIGIEGAVQHVVEQPVRRTAGATDGAVVIESGPEFPGGDQTAYVRIGRQVPGFVEEHARRMPERLSVGQVELQYAVARAIRQPIADFGIGAEIPVQIERGPGRFRVLAAKQILGSEQLAAPRLAGRDGPLAGPSRPPFPGNGLYVLHWRAGFATWLPICASVTSVVGRAARRPAGGCRSPRPRSHARAAPRPCVRRSAAARRGCRRACGRA